MSWREDVKAALTSALGVEVSYDEGFGPPTFDVPAEQWIDALSALRAHGFDFFDFLTAVDELDSGFTVACHLAALRGPGSVEHLVVRTRLSKAAAALPTATGVFAGASWHERETHEMFGIDFPGHPGLAPLLLPDEFEGHPLRKDFVLAARVAKAWPGAKEPGESDHDTGGRSPSRRRMAPPGVPGPDAWGPRLPGSPTPDPAAATAPTRPARPARRERPSRAVTASAEHATGRPGTEPAAPADPTTIQEAAAQRVAGEVAEKQEQAAGQHVAEGEAAREESPERAAEPGTPTEPDTSATPDEPVTSADEGAPGGGDPAPPPATPPRQREGDGDA